MSVQVTLIGKCGKEEEETTIQSGDLTNKEFVFYLTKAATFGSLNDLLEWANTHFGAKTPDLQELKGLNLPDFLTHAVTAVLNLKDSTFTLIGLIIDQPHGLYHFEICADLPEKQPSIPGLNLIKLAGIGFVLTKAGKRTFGSKATDDGREVSGPDI
jgi:hypothetical protein